MSYIVYGGDCPGCGHSPFDGFEGEGVGRDEFIFECDNCGADFILDFTGDWSDE